MFRPVCVRAAARLSTAGRSPVAMRSRCASTYTSFDWKDPLGSNNMFTEEELAIAETAESYCQERLLPRVTGISEEYLNVERRHS
jgi:glutaryl-CoA dehydrogenase